MSFTNYALARTSVIVVEWLSEGDLGIEEIYGI